MKPTLSGSAPKKDTRKRSRPGRKDYHKPGRKRPPRLGRSRRPCDETIIGIDGEGQGRAPHRYTYLAAVDEHDTFLGAVANPSGLSTTQCLDFLVDLPGKRLFGYAFMYDLTMILKDLSDEKIFSLTHEESRKVTWKGRTYFKSVQYGEFLLNFLNRKLTIRRCRWNGARTVGYGKTQTVWDVFRFFACKFTDALTNWNIADKEKLRSMARMKDLRSTFDQLKSSEIQAYCREECGYMARLVRELIDAHESIGLRLKNFYGAGSTASALLDSISAKDALAPPPEAMQHAAAAAFFGGRFETSYIGVYKKPIYNADINSAYPYQIAQLPCLTHGRWSRVQGRGLLARVRRARLALVHCKVAGGKNSCWGPLPWRHPNGTIAFPLASGGIWAWKPEALLAIDSDDFRVRADEAWVYDTPCACKPFEKIPAYYLERCKWGKESKGIVLKLGPNSIYGKTAQSKGTPKYQSWVWAGNITSGTRAQLLGAVLSAKNPWDVLMLATDGIWSKQPLKLPPPVDLGTGSTGKPLGGWDVKVIQKGAFLARPGIYFPLSPTPEEIKDVKARGIAKAVLLEHADRLVDWWHTLSWQDRPKSVYTFSNLVRFVGMKSGITISKKRREEYGEWVECPLQLSFDPLPKRSGVILEKLLPWYDIPGESSPYKPAVVSPDARALQAMEREMADQPDGDLSEAGLE